MSTKQDFLNRYPEFDPIDNDDYFNSVLAQSQRQVTEKVWGVTYNDGLFALIAHYLELGKKDRAGRAGHIVEERLGPAATALLYESPYASLAASMQASLLACFCVSECTAERS